MGIYWAQGVRVNSNKRSLRNIFTTYLDVVSYKKTDIGRLGIETEMVDESEAWMVEKSIEDNDPHTEFVKFTEAEVEKF